MSSVIDDNARLAIEIASKLQVPAERFGRMESHVEILARDVAELKADVKGLRTEMTSEFKSVRGELGSEFKSVRGELGSEFKSVRSEMRSDFRWLLSTMIAFALGLAGMMAKGFHWV